MKDIYLSNYYFFLLSQKKGGSCICFSWPLPPSRHPPFPPPCPRQFQPAVVSEGGRGSRWEDREKMPSSRRSLGNFQSSPVPISHAFKDRFRRGKKTSQPQTSVIPIHLTGLSILRWAARSSWARDVISPPCSTRFTFSMVFETFPRIVSFAVKNLPFQVTYMK